MIVVSGVSEELDGMKVTYRAMPDYLSQVSCSSRAYNGACQTPLLQTTHKVAQDSLAATCCSMQATSMQVGRSCKDGYRNVSLVLLMLLG